MSKWLNVVVIFLICLNGTTILYFTQHPHYRHNLYKKSNKSLVDFDIAANHTKTSTANLRTIVKPHGVGPPRNSTVTGTNRKLSTTTRFSPNVITQSLKGFHLLPAQEEIDYGDHNDIKRTSDAWMSENAFTTMMRNRIENIRNVCHQTSLSRATPSTSNHLYAIKRKNITYCPVFKAASSLWLENMINLSGATDRVKAKAKSTYPGDLIQQAKFVGIGPTTGNLHWKAQSNAYTRRNSSVAGIAFVIVRHPFERLVSAFRDKLERTHRSNAYYYEKYGKHIVKEFRDRAVTTLGANFFSQANNFGALLAVPGNRRPDATLPSFWEFVKYILHSTLPVPMDEHWMPIYQYCSICEEHHRAMYNYILRFEDIGTEQSAFARHLNWRGHGINFAHINQNRPDGMSSYEVTQLYFSLLSDDDIKNLYKMYGPDFLLFDYSFQRGDIILPPTKNL